MWACEVCERVDKGAALDSWTTVVIHRNRLQAPENESIQHEELHFCASCWRSSNVYRAMTVQIAWAKGLHSENIP